MTTRNAVLEMFLSGAWTTVPLYSAAGVTITRGHEPDGSWPRPTRIECEIANDTLAYDPSRPDSPLYGVAGRNTKTRITVDTNQRVWVEASSWTPDRTPEHVPGVRGRSWTKLTAEGVLRRIGMWTDPLRSPMYRTISARPTSIGHWPLEDGRDALLLSNTLAGGPAGTFKGGAALAESEAPLGAEQTVKTVVGSQLTGVFASASTTTGWQVVFSAKLAALPSGAGYQSLLTWTTSNGYTWSWTTNNANYFISVVASDGTVLYNNGTAWSTQGPPTEWMTFRLKASVSGGTVTIEPAWYRQSAPVVTGFTDTFAGSVGRLVQWWQVGASYTDGAWFSHVFAVTGLTDALTSGTAIAVFNGYLGERAGDRFQRLCGELGITYYMIGTAAETQPMGPQRAVTFLELLKEIRETDDCRIDDERFDIALTMRTRRVMYNQTAALTLTYPSQVAVPFNKILDDLNTHNRVTVKNASGGEVTSSLLSGPMSVLAPPAGVGEYKASVDVSVANPATQLQDIADWHRAKGTIERPRYAEVTVDLLANPSLVSAAMNVREGDMIAVVGAEPETVRFLVDGIIEKVSTAPWTVTYQVELYDVWIIGVYDDGVWRWDTRTTTLAAGATSTATSLSLTTVDVNDTLTTAAGSLPYDLMIEGERVTVTAMTAAAGTGPYTQTATVTRSINGVAKAQLAGARVNVYDSKRWGL
ncbi:MAG TPA: hypothetical protein VGQ92_17920 [Actinoplanes sp.]|jgi:hypothetical protein|nr:hypothetical protein [Actinoplanes sp.]